MPVGLLYDVHGNLPALEAVLADAASLGIDRWVLGGDYASFGAWPAEVVDLLSTLGGAVWIRGNWDRWQIGERDDFPDNADLEAGLAAVCAALGPERVARLGALPAEHRDGETLFCHGAPGTDMDSFLPQPAEQDDALLGDTDARRIVFGHTHLQFTREHRGVTLLNPGSVGFSFDGDPRAAWAVLTDGGDIDLRRVEYDIEAVAGALEDRWGPAPWVDGTAARLRRASFFLA